MEQSRLEKCIKALQKKGVNKPCPRCGEMKFSIVGESLIAINENPKVTVVGGPSVPTILVACDNCGYVTQHAQGVLELLRQVNEK